MQRRARRGPAAAEPGRDRRDDAGTAEPGAAPPAIEGGSGGGASPRASSLAFDPPTAVDGPIDVTVELPTPAPIAPALPTHDVVDCDVLAACLATKTLDALYTAAEGLSPIDLAALPVKYASIESLTAVGPQPPKGRQSVSTCQLDWLYFDAFTAVHTGWGLPHDRMPGKIAAHDVASAIVRHGGPDQVRHAIAALRCRVLWS